jgi:transposase
LKIFLRRLQPWLAGILAHSRWPLDTNLIVSINNKIWASSAGLAYTEMMPAFFLKIRAALPAVG